MLSLSLQFPQGCNLELYQAIFIPVQTGFIYKGGHWAMAVLFPAESRLMFVESINLIIGSRSCSAGCTIPATRNDPGRKRSSLSGLLSPLFGIYLKISSVWWKHMQEDAGNSSTELTFETVRGTLQRKVYDCGYFSLIFAERIKNKEVTPWKFSAAKVRQCEFLLVNFQPVCRSILRTLDARLLKGYASTAATTRIPKKNRRRNGADEEKQQKSNVDWRQPIQKTKPPSSLSRLMGQLV